MKGLIQQHKAQSKILDNLQKEIMSSINPNDIFMYIGDKESRNYYIVLYAAGSNRFEAIFHNNNVYYRRSFSFASIISLNMQIVTKEQYEADLPNLAKIGNPY